ncbi:hypothetical protein ACOI22_02875 [Glaciecola sp. 2405UD65-10]|uniref:hypothetical protein n=1 Tax=Glaciecola sp. 2405UD65-10 TaxID=3397244 RepID=UPI003B5CA31D
MKNKKLSANAEKQKRFRDKQKALGKKMVRGYLSPVAMENYKEIVEKTGWTDNDIISNSLRITYAAYKNGQIRFLNKWLQEDDRKKRLKNISSMSAQAEPEIIDNSNVSKQIDE